MSYIAEMRRFLAVLVLCGINKVRNRLVWSARNAQVMVGLFHLMSRHCFEAISSFLHVVSAEEEQKLSDHPLKKILPLHNRIKEKCFELYHPLQELSIDERMVRNKDRHRFRQYIKNKPTKWGFKFWVLADPTGYTIDFNPYKSETESVGEHRLAYDVVMKLLQPLFHQNYHLSCNNFYSSPHLFQALLGKVVAATGTVNPNRHTVPQTIKTLKKALGSTSIKRGTGFWVRPTGSGIVYICWKDS